MSIWTVFALNVYGEINETIIKYIFDRFLEFENVKTLILTKFKKNVQNLNDVINLMPKTLNNLSVNWYTKKEPLNYSIECYNTVVYFYSISGPGEAVSATNNEINFHCTNEIQVDYLRIEGSMNDWILDTNQLEYITVQSFKSLELNGMNFEK